MLTEPLTLIEPLIDPPLADTVSALTLPLALTSLTVTVPALKSPKLSRLTSVLALELDVALLTALATGLSCEVKARDAPASVEDMHALQSRLPEKEAVIVPALKLPPPSRHTIVFA